MKRRLDQCPRDFFSFFLFSFFLVHLENGSCLWGEGGGEGRRKRFLGTVADGGSAAEAEARRGPLIADREVTGATQQPKAPPSRYQFSLPRFPARFPVLWPTPLLPWSLRTGNPRPGALQGGHSLGVLVGVGRGVVATTES